MNTYRTCVLLCLVVLLSGCVTKIQYVDRPHFPPVSLLADCEVAEPPEKDKYLQSEWSGIGGKEDQWVKAYISQTYNVSRCNVSKRSLRDWKSEVETKLKQLEKKEAP